MGGLPSDNEGHVPSSHVENFQQSGDDGNIVLGNAAASTQVATTANEVADTAGVEAVLDSSNLSGGDIIP